MATGCWEFWIDVGGTFTDCIAKSPDRVRHRHKLLSSGITKGHIEKGSSRDSILDGRRRGEPSNCWIGWTLTVVDDQGNDAEQSTVVGFDSAEGRLQLEGLASAPAAGAHYELRSAEEAPIVAIRYLLNLPLQQRIPPITLRLGTTRGTNALITRSGAKVALVTTRGFGDVLEIGYQARPRLFDLTVRKPTTIASKVVEIDERITHDGQILQSPSIELVRQQLTALRQDGIDSLAICLLNADRHPAHEEALARVAQAVGFQEISVSHRVAPLPKLVARADTTTLSAYLNPVLRTYVDGIASSLEGSSLRCMTSSGGLVSGEYFSGKDSILSGPAGGVVGFSRCATAAGYSRAIGFDMGGTSTDVSRFEGRYDLDYETEKAGVRVVAPAMAIETVAAGGGSICRFDGVKLVVGPGSASANPGPACYGRGGPLTVTDINLFLGRIATSQFPFPLDVDATKRRLLELLNEVNSSTAVQYGLTELALGLLRVANVKMASAIRRVTVAKGANPSDFVLVAFGGAAPQHACAVAAELGIRTILIPPDAGILSALGIGLADVTRHRSFGVELPLDSSSLGEVAAKLDSAEREAHAQIRAEGIAPQQILAHRFLDLRYQGTDAYLTIPWPADDDFVAAFETAHERRYGYRQSNAKLEIAAARVEVIGTATDELPRSEQQTARDITVSDTARVHFGSEFQQVPLVERAKLEPGSCIAGPALVTDDFFVAVVEEGWKAEVLSGGDLLLRQFAYSESTLPLAETDQPSDSSDPVLLEVFNNLLTSIAEQMGSTLQNTARSVNVKERLDFSCALFTGDGRLVANAPHVPVHLGAMEETVKHVVHANPDLGPGDVIVTNDPFAGGSHLPDVTVVTPVHDITTGERLFFTASRAHHAEIGGIAPGSMPPEACNLAEEGVLIRNFKVLDGGKSHLEALHHILSSAPYPSRDPATNVADIEAQIAANRQGALDLLQLVDRYGWPLVERYMEFVQQAAEDKVRAALARFEPGHYAYTDYLDLPSQKSPPIQVAITIHDEGSEKAATIDFAGTGPVLKSNLNANRAIVNAAVIYVLRLLVDDDIPLNHGVMRGVDVRLPTCLLNPPFGDDPRTLPGVAGGNVETSQRIVDVLLGALKLAAASQGTMNNVLFGNDSFGYYETICGGSGATPEASGASAVQVHMTNTRITDPEILERRFPVRVKQFAIRRASGGNGFHRGGDGVVRSLEFLENLDVSLLTQRRGPHPPYGLAGGEPGACGRNTLERADGTFVELPCIAAFSVAPGDVLTIETPGGGGYGTPGTQP